MFDLILFGAGASHGSDSVGTPPLTADLFDALQSFNPPGWGAVDPHMAERFREDFEAGMVQQSNANPHALPPLQRAMAAYFFGFAPRVDNLYVRLAKRLLAAQWDGAVCSLNYERLLELSLVSVGIKPIVNSTTEPGQTMELCLPHGCCHLFSDAVRGDARAISFAGLNVQTNGPISAISDPAQFKTRIERDAFPPVMSYFEPSKRTTSGASFIAAQRTRWAELVSESATVVLIGIKVRPHDEHIWDPLAQAAAKLVYCSGESSAREFEEWAGTARPGRTSITLPGYFADEFEPICEAIEV